MNKTKLLNVIDNSLLKFDSTKKNIYERYFPILEALLISIPNDIALDNFTSLEPFRNAETFNVFFERHSFDEVDACIKQLIEKIGPISKKFADKAQDEKRALQQYNVWEQKRHSQNHFRLNLFSALFIILAGVLFIVAILEFAGVIDSGNIISGVIGLADLCCGVVFFVCEQFDDRKKQVVQEKVHGVIPQIKIVNRGNKIHGSDNDVNYGSKNNSKTPLSVSMNDIENEEKQRKEAITDFEIHIKNTNNRIKGKNNNINYG